MRVCINLYPFAAGSGGGIETVSRWIVDIPQRVPTAHEFTVLLNPAAGRLTKRLRRGQPYDPFAVAGTGARSRPHLLRRAYDSRFVPQALRSIWRIARRSMRRTSLDAPALRRRWLEAQGFDVIHCPYQVMDPPPPEHVRVPCCINMHDLQHEHFPHFFSAGELAHRRRSFREAAQIAAAVFVIADHVKADIVHYLGVMPEKIHVIWPGPPFEGLPPVTDDQREEARRRLALPERFFVYPAVTWEHKNHIRLLQALARVRERRGYRLSLVFSGAPGPHHAAVLTESARLELEDQTWWLGYLSFQDLRCLYTLADAVVAPTLYEASSAPVLEALSMGCPVACSTVANLPWLVDGGRAGLLFDPTDVGAIADALERLWEDQGLRHRLAAAGLERVAAFSWESFAEGYLRVYEEVATRD